MTLLMSVLGLSSLRQNVCLAATPKALSLACINGGWRHIMVEVVRGCNACYWLLGKSCRNPTESRVEGAIP